MSDSAASADGAKKCPGCGYDVSGSSASRCPECGRTLSAWTTRWKPWHVAAGLDLLMWGLPLVALGVVLAGLGDVRRVEFFTGRAFLFSGLAVAVCVGGLVLMSVSEGRRCVIPVFISIAMLVCVSIAASGSPNRFWLAVGPSGAPMLFPNLGRETPAGAIAMLAGVAACYQTGRVLRSLSREFDLEIGRAAWIPGVVVAAALAITLGGDITALWTTSPPPTGSATKFALVVRTRFDFWMQLATGLAIGMLWLIVVAVRARIRWDLARNSQ